MYVVCPSLAGNTSQNSCNCFSLQVHSIQASYRHYRWHSLVPDSGHVSPTAQTKTLAFLYPDLLQIAFHVLRRAADQVRAVHHVGPIKAWYRQYRQDTIQLQDQACHAKKLVTELWTESLSTKLASTAGLKTGQWASQTLNPKAIFKKLI